MLRLHGNHLHALYRYQITNHDRYGVVLRGEYTLTIADRGDRFSWGERAIDWITWRYT
jgi:hypothetical protein